MDVSLLVLNMISPSSSTLTTSSIFVHSFFAVFFFIIGHGFHSLPHTGSTVSPGEPRRAGGGGVFGGLLPSKRLTCRWLWSHFPDYIDYWGFKNRKIYTTLSLTECISSLGVQWRFWKASGTYPTKINPSNPPGNETASPCVPPSRAFTF